MTGRERDAGDRRSHGSLGRQGGRDRRRRSGLDRGPTFREGVGHRPRHADDEHETDGARTLHPLASNPPLQQSGEELRIDRKWPLCLPESPRQFLVKLRHRSPPARRSAG